LTVFDDLPADFPPPSETELLFDNYEYMLFDDDEYVIES